MAAEKRKPRLAVWKFASCDGCQLSLLDCEDELLAIAGAIDIAYFPEATRGAVKGRYDLSLVEGSITTAHDARRIHTVRRRSRALVTIGACATAGGIQGLRNFADVAEYASVVYAHPDYIETLATSTPIADHVPVDFELRGCPISKRQLVEVIAAFLVGRRPVTPAHSVCVECKLRGNVCVMVAHGTPCLVRLPMRAVAPFARPMTVAATAATARWRVRTRLRSPAGCAISAWTAGRCSGLGARSTPTLRSSVRKANAMARKTIKVDYLARVEGEGSFKVVVRDGAAQSAELSIFEPPRFFEALLRGRDFSEAPDITARICGICPIAYQMSAVHAMEAALGVSVSGPLRDLRRLIYCGEWIESHTPHIYMLHAPDFLGYDGAIDMARDHEQVVRRGLELKKIGNEILTLLGGREIHPINVRVGGFYRTPRRRELAPLAERLKRARDAALDTVRWTAGFDFPGRARDYTFVALRHGSEYPFNEGRIVSNRGLDISVRDYDQHFEERHVARSTALHSRMRGGGAYLVGPMARYSLNFDRLSPLAQEAAREAGLGPTCTNPYRSIVVRAVEVLYACDDALRIIDGYEEPESPVVEVQPGPARGLAAPRRPGGCCITAIGWRRTGPSPKHRSCRRPHRTRQASRRI